MASPLSPISSTSPSTSRPKSLAKVCQRCRSRKIKCDTKRPSCGSCLSAHKICSYEAPPAKPRPSTAIINSIQRERDSLADLLLQLKSSNASERNILLENVVVQENDKIQLLNGQATHLPLGSSATEIQHKTIEPGHMVGPTQEEGWSSAREEPTDPSLFLTVSDTGQVGAYGPSSAFGGGRKKPKSLKADADSIARFMHELIANAALQRQKEHSLRHMDFIRGIPADLALHLLDLHWNRQHHTYLLTYRPAFMRELVSGGQYCTDFLLNAIFACSSKYSGRIELRDNPLDPESAGRHFFRRCDELLSEGFLLSQSSVPSIISLLMLGSTLNARGQTSKGWLYTGYALRMVYDLGLHLDRASISENPEEVEICRRVFWGAFLCDKLQSLFLGRPISLQSRDCNVQLDLMDTYEENEPWSPYMDPKLETSSHTPSADLSMAIHSVSAFQGLCSLAKIMNTIINEVYCVGVTAEGAQSKLVSVNRELESWYEKLPPHLIFEPWKLQPNTKVSTAPNIMILLATYHSLIILLHRPFTANGHLRARHLLANSWQRCSAAASNITSLLLSYSSTFPLRRAPYILTYATYVACTIHVRNISAGTELNARQRHVSMLGLCLQFLDELSVPNPGSSLPARIIRNLMAALEIAEPSTGDVNGASFSMQTGSDAACNFTIPTEFDAASTYHSNFDYEAENRVPLFGFMDDAFLLDSLGEQFLG